MSEKLPERYVPKILRPKIIPQKPREVRYACGYEREPNQFGMWAGPFVALEDALEQVPEEDSANPCIIRFNRDGTDEVLYRWNEQGVWLRESR